MSAGVHPIGIFGARVFVSGLAAACLIWAVGAGTTFWSQAGVDGMARQTLRGEVFRPDAVRGLMPDDRSPELVEANRSGRLGERPDNLRNLAVLQLSLAEAAVASSSPDALSDLQRLQEFTVAALSASPGDGFLWLALFWAKSSAEGVTSRTLPLLRQSYLLAPHEGWVALRRIRLSLAVYPSLPPDLAEHALREFRDLVASGFEIGAADILIDVAPALRQKLVDGLSALPDRNRRKLAENLRARNLFDVTVPGIERSEPRPWM